MRLDECYRLLEVPAAASDAEVKRAYRDLTKVWHPDRFAHDAALRERAEEKLKAINEAYERIMASRGSSFRSAPDDANPRDDTSWRVRVRDREVLVSGLSAIAALVARGRIGADAEVFDPNGRRWMRVREMPELRSALATRRLRVYRARALTCAAIGVFLLLRRPTPGGLAIALVLLVAAFVFVSLMRK